MFDQQVLDQRVPVAGRGQRAPARGRRGAPQRGQVPELRVQRFRVGDEVRVLLAQQRQPLRQRRLDPHARTPPHRLDQVLRHANLADFPALGLDVHRARRVERDELRAQRGLEPLLRGLRRVRQVAQQRAAVARQRLEVERLRPGGAERLQQPALAGPGQPADHAIRIRLRQPREFVDDMAPVCLVAAFELHGLPADFVEHMRKGAGALAPAPAVNKRLPLAGPAGERGLEHRGDVLRDQSRAGLPRGERRILLVQRAHQRALRVVENRMARRARQVIERELGRAAHVDALGELRQALDADDVRRPAGHQRCGSSLRSSGHTRSSISGCACAVGWMRSAWNISGFSPKPSRMNGTSAALRARATSLNSAANSAM